MIEEQELRLKPVDGLDDLVKFIGLYNTLVEPFKGICPTHRSDVQVIEDILTSYHRGDCIYGSESNGELEYFIVFTIRDTLGLVYLMYLNKDFMKQSSEFLTILKGVARFNRVERFYFNSANFQHSFRRWASKQGALVNSIQYVMEV
jgi:hypothetical protein